jgi:glycosyltransferase involved in cell wall biosynthesis
MTQNKPKKIAIVYSGAKHWGGIETYLLSLFENIDSPKIELTLFSLGEWELTRKLRTANYQLRIFPSRRIRLQTIWEMKKVLRENDFDLIVSQGTVANAYARAVAWLSGLPNLVTVHSVRDFDYSNPIILSIYNFIERLTRFPTSRYIAVSKYIKDVLVKSGVAADRIAVILNGVKDLGLDSSVRTRNDGKLIIGSIGRLHSTKGFHNLILACAKLQTIDFKLQIAGEGDERYQLEQLIKKLGLSGRVELLGHVDDVATLLGDWDVYVQPSLSEGFGITVIEAMLAGKPVVVTPVGSLPELVSDGKTGIITAGTSPEAIAAALKLVIDNEELAKRIAVAGRTDVEMRFGIEKWIKETEKVYLGAAR